MWKYVNSKGICVISLFISPNLDFNWRSDLVIMDCQQNPPSLTFAHPEQIAKYLDVDQELLLCRILFISVMPITEYSFAT
jgi:hypothetical protein